MTNEPAESDGVRDGDGTADEPADIEPAENALSAEDLQYPEFDAGDGVGPDGSLAFSRDLDRDGMATWLEDLAGGLASHDLAFDGDTYRAAFGVAPDGVDVRFEPDDDHRGTIELTLRLDAMVMDVADADLPKVGARGGRGFIPLAMLTDDPDRTYHCYNWIDNPLAGIDGDGDAAADGRDGDGDAAADRDAAADDEVPTHLADVDGDDPADE